MLIHSPTGVGQAGSYRAAYFDQKMPMVENFDVYATDEQGFVLPRDDENTMKDCSNLNTIAEFHEKSKSAEILKMNKMAFEGLGWKVVNKQQRDGDKGGMLAAQCTKKPLNVKPGYFLLQDENGADYWQKYADGAAVDGDFTYEPAVAFDVVAGGKYFVLNDQTKFDSFATKSGTPYDGNTWADLSRDVLGWEVTVESIVTDSDWPNYNCVVKVQHEEGGPEKTHTIPIRALCTEDEGATALFFGEVGMWILSAELALYPCDGYADRGKSMQPLVSEFKGVLEALSGLDDMGYMEVVDAEDDEEYYNLKGDIQAWCTEATTEWDYGAY